MMEDGQLHQISAEIGALKEAVKLMTSLWTTQEAAAVLGRKVLHDKFDMLRQELGLDVAGLSARVDRLTDKVTVIEPSVQQFKDEKLRAEGAKLLGVKLYAALLAGASALGWAAHELMTFLRPPIH